MEKNIKILKEIFNSIRKIEFHKSLRMGDTGVGYTFETLLNKKEDHNYLPDFNGIEIKTKMGYSKTPLTLFSLVPNGYENTIKFILDNYGYPDNTKQFKAFRGNASCNQNKIISHKYIFKLKVNEINSRLELIILDLNLNILNNKIYWELDEIKNRLYTKLNYLAIVKSYPYKINNEIHYKYTSLHIYKLKDFNVFLKLLKTDEISVTFNIGCFKNGPRLGDVHDHGTAFKINIDCIEKLFESID